MKFGKVLVEQVDRDGNIIEGYDTSLSSEQLYSAVKLNFPEISKDEYGIINGVYSGKKFSIRIKNVTYLGNPHPIYKKRIQIPDDLRFFYDKSMSQGYCPLLLGLYYHDDNIVFCDFRIEDFLHKKAHNSSAHIYISDLAAATVDKYFQKIDSFGNQITAFTSDSTAFFLKTRLFDICQSWEKYSHDYQDLLNTNVNTISSDVDTKRDNEQLLQSKESKKLPKTQSQHFARMPSQMHFPRELRDEIWRFFKGEEKIWNGVECYNKMIRSEYRNKFQPEWPGFFLEYEFEQFIEKNQLQNLVCYYQDRSKDGIDLDLYFPVIDNFGDLKAHSDHSRGIQGNDLDTVLNTVRKYGHVYYIVCEHSTVKDQDCGYEVTQFWNRVQAKVDLMSYSKRMKNQVTLKRVMILDINLENAKYLSIFRQGINSDGNPRSPKIMIEMDKLGYFLIEECEL